tara:strand:- start:178 stop:630 length:453 start_codon:yes stop_codon:yes gene_type:complete
MTTTTVDLTTALSKNQRGNLLKRELAKVLRSLGFTVEIEKPYNIRCNSNPIRIDLVINNILGLENKLYMDTNMAYKFVGPMPEIVQDNPRTAPTRWAALCGQDAGGFPFLRNRAIPCYALDESKRCSSNVKQEFGINHDRLEAFILDALQ